MGRKEHGKNYHNNNKPRSGLKTTKHFGKKKNKTYEVDGDEAEDGHSSGGSGEESNEAYHADGTEDEASEETLVTKNLCPMSFRML